MTWTSAFTTTVKKKIIAQYHSKQAEKLKE